MYLNLRVNPAVCLSIHCLRPQSSSHQKHILSRQCTEKKKWDKGAESWSANQPDPVSQEGSGQEYKITKQMIWWTKISILCSSQTFSINSCTLTSLWMAHRSSSWFLCIPVGQHPFTSQKIRSAKTKFALTCSSWKKIWTLTTEKNSETLFFF